MAIRVGRRRACLHVVSTLLEILPVTEKQKSFAGQKSVGVSTLLEILLAAAVILALSR